MDGKAKPSPYRDGQNVLTEWIGYFCSGMSDAFARVRSKLAKIGREDDQRPLLRELDQRQKLVLDLFRTSRFITTAEVAEHLKLHRRTALNLCHAWTADGFIVLHGEAKKSRRYELAGKWLPLAT
jgi:hypothetical protein